MLNMMLNAYSSLVWGRKLNITYKKKLDSQIWQIENGKITNSHN